MARHGTWRRALVSLVALAGVAALAPAASASIGSPALTLTPSSQSAASTANLGTDIRFTPAGGDSVKNLTLQLPPGLIANASVDGGACLQAKAPIPACAVGSGTVTATENLPLGLAVPLSLPAQFSLVAPPTAGDLAGLQVSVKDPTTNQYAPLGTPAAVSLRGSGDPAGLGLDIAFTNIPDTYPVLGVPTSISVTEINGTFDGLRFPASCPATPAAVSVSSSSYSDATVRSASAPLTVTGCSALPFSPGFTIAVARDSADKQVEITTDITQAAGQATPRSVQLTLPTPLLSPNLAVIALECANPATGTCTPVGSTTATSPLYPAALRGKAYLTGQPGTLAAPSLTLVFPAPFPITLTGAVNLATNSTTFTGVPDIPLSDLQVELDGGAHGVFSSNCAISSGTATSTLVSQNGDKTATVPAPFTVSNCTAPAQGPASGGGSGKGRPRLSGAHIWGLLRGHAAMAFTVRAARGAPKLRALTVQTTRGLRFVRRRQHRRLRVAGVSLRSAKLRSVSLSHGRLLITLRKPVSSVTVTIGRYALRESAALRSKAQHAKVKSLRLGVLARDATGLRTMLRTQIRRLGLPGRS